MKVIEIRKKLENGSPLILDGRQLQSSRESIDRIEGDQIILDEKGQFPKRVVIVQPGGGKREYRLVKTKSGKFFAELMLTASQPVASLLGKPAENVP